MELDHYLIKMAKRKKAELKAAEVKYIIAFVLYDHGYLKKQACKAANVNQTNFCRIEEIVKVRRELYPEFEEYYSYIDKAARRFFIKAEVNNESVRKYLLKQFKKKI